MSINAEFTEEQRMLRRKALSLAANIVGPGINEAGLRLFKKAYIFILSQLQGESLPLPHKSQHKDSESG